MTAQRVLCCGGRDFYDRAFVDARLTDLRAMLGDFVIIHGGARGADTLCGEWGAKQGLPVICVMANWNFYGKRAGSLRNSWMLDYCFPIYGMAFPGGTGTADMVRKMTAAGLPVWAL